MTAITARLPYPPSVNHYWELTVGRSRSGRRPIPMVRVSDSGQRYAASVRTALEGVQTLAGRLLVRIVANPPDRRTRDLDNVLKCLLDSLTKAGLWEDDSQIDMLVVARGACEPGGSVNLLVEQLESEFRPRDARPTNE